MTSKVKIPGVEGEWVEVAYGHLPDRYVVISDRQTSTNVSETRYYTPALHGWRELPAGGELDEMVARMVFPNHAYLNIPHFSTDTREAMHVVNGMRGKGWSMQMYDDVDRGQVVEFWMRGNYNIASWAGGSDEIALIICKAALATLEVAEK